jgi:acid phosphatase
VLTIVEENHGYNQMLSGMPNLKSLANRYGYATHYDALTHPSLPNYLALAAGSTFGVTTDCGVSSCPQSSTTVFDQAIAAGHTAGVYAEDMTSNCQQSGSGDGLYAVRHTAWPYFTNATSRKNCLAFQVPSGSASSGNFHDDVLAGKLPNVGWLIPNLCNDAHDSGCSLGRADTWLGNMLDLVFASPDWKSGELAVVITADEDNGSEGNQVLTVVAHPGLSGVTVDTHLDHYSLTRFQEDVVGVGYLGNASSAADLAAAFGLTTG